MRALVRPLVAGAVVAAALLGTVPAAQAAPAAAEVQCLVPNCDPFWLFRPCGPLVKCP